MLFGISIKTRTHRRDDLSGSCISMGWGPPRGAALGGSAGCLAHLTGAERLVRLEGCHRHLLPVDLDEGDRELGDDDRTRQEPPLPRSGVEATHHGSDHFWRCDHDVIALGLERSSDAADSDLSVCQLGHLLDVRMRRMSDVDVEHRSGGRREVLRCMVDPLRADALLLQEGIEVRPIGRDMVDVL